ncbi:unnamed protein product [Sphacelaria rigidula]
MLPSEPVISTGGVQQTVSGETGETISRWTSEAVSSWRSLKPGEVSGFQSEGIRVEKEERWCLADLSVLRAGAQTVCPVEAILNSGSGIMTMSVGVAAKLQAMIPDIRVVTPMSGKQLVKLANGNVERMKQKSCPVQTALYTSWGPVALDPCSYAVMPRTDDVKIMGSPTLEALGIDVYSSLGDCARARNTSVQGVNTPDFTDCRRSSIAVDALQQPGGRAEPVYSSVERLLSRSLAMSISPKQELAELDVAPEGAVQATADNGISESDVSQIREPVRSRASIFRRTLHGYPPPRVEPLKVKFKPVVVEAKARPRAYFSVRMALLARCIATLVALELVSCGLQVVWARAASATPEKSCFRWMGAYKTGEEVPRPHKEVVHGARPGKVLHFSFLSVSEGGPLGDADLDEGDPFKYVLVRMDDPSDFVRLEPAESCTAATTVKHLLTWCKALGPQEGGISDTASQYENRVVRVLEQALMDRRFVVANSRLSYRECERMMRDIVRTLKVIMQEGRRNADPWIGLVPAVQWALNTGFEESYESCSCISDARSDCSGGNATLRCGRDRSRRAAVSQEERRRITRRALPKVLDVAVSAGLADVKELVLVELLVENEEAHCDLYT